MCWALLVGLVLAPCAHAQGMVPDTGRMDGGGVFNVHMEAALDRASIIYLSSSSAGLPTLTGSRCPGRGLPALPRATEPRAIKLGYGNCTESASHRLRHVEENSLSHCRDRE